MLLPQRSSLIAIKTVSIEEKKESKVDLAHLSGMPVQLSVVLGKCKMKLEDVLKIGPGTIVEPKGCF